MGTSAIAEPTNATMHALCARVHRQCFACRPASSGGLGLDFGVQPDGSVSTGWICPEGGESYEGIVHGGLLATAMDSAMVHALFARGIVAVTGELVVRYRQSVRAGEAVIVSARLVGGYPPLYSLAAGISQDGVLCVKAHAKFMEKTGAAGARLSSDRLLVPQAQRPSPVYDSQAT